MTVWDDPVGFDPMKDGPPYLGTDKPRVASVSKSVGGRVASELAPDVLAAVRGWATQCLEACGDQPRVELSVVVKALQGAAMIHQGNHWQVAGPTYYGDHLLFQRLYEDTDGFVDGVAEKAVGTGTPMLVNPVLQSSQVSSFVATLYPGVVQLSETDMVIVSQNTVLAVLFLLGWAIKSLEYRGQLTNGIDNMLQGIADKHEEFAYLLQQRLAHTSSEETSKWKR